MTWSRAFGKSDSRRRAWSSGNSLSLVAPGEQHRLRECLECVDSVEGNGRFEGLRDVATRRVVRPCCREMPRRPAVPPRPSVDSCTPTSGTSAAPASWRTAAATLRLREAEPARDTGDSIEALRWEVLVAVAVGQHQPTDALDARVTTPERGEAQPAAGVVPDQRHVTDVERFEEGRDPSRGRPRRDIGVGGRIAMGTERPRRHDASHPVETHRRARPTASRRRRRHGRTPPVGRRRGCDTES